MKITIGLAMLIWIVWSLALAVRTADPIAEAWECRCDTCCEYLEEVAK